MQTEIAESFVKERKSFQRHTKYYCPTCWSERQLATHKWSLLWTFGIGIIGALLIWWSPEFGTGWLLTNLFLFQFFLILTIVPHELSHALIAHYVGFRVFAVNIGFGQKLWKGKFLGLDVELKVIPVGGVTLVAPRETKRFRRKLFLIVVAGPLINLAIALLTMAFAGKGVWNWNQVDQRPIPLTMLFYANVWVLVFNLWPRVIKLLGNTASDGKQLLNIPFLKSGKIEEAHAFWFAGEAARCHDRGDFEDANLWFERGLALYPNNVLLLNGRGLRLLQQSKYEEERNCFSSLLKSDSEKPAFRAVILNNIAYTNVLIGKQELLDEADRFSQEAMANLGSMPSIRGTRGAVLAELGRFNEALPLLHDAMQRGASASSKAQNACLIAMAEARQGNVSGAQKFLFEARKLDARCPLLERAEVVVAG
ncbi:MAG: site-2 protease family protein [Verrucomicrobia bacterium]|nr:site-2 protease family protein [Verrucomicrobiota bacterium]